MAFDSRDDQEEWSRSGRPDMLPPHGFDATGPADPDLRIGALLDVPLSARELPRDLDVVCAQIREQISDRGPAVLEMLWNDLSRFELRTARAVARLLLADGELGQQEGLDIAGKRGVVLHGTDSLVEARLILHEETLCPLSYELRSIPGSDPPALGCFADRTTKLTLSSFPSDSPSSPSKPSA